MPRADRLAAEYVLPLRWHDDRDVEELTAYLRVLSDIIDVTVVDGSPPPIYSSHHIAWSDFLRHVAPAPWPGGNGKVAGVVTGVRVARHEEVVIADDDVRWNRPGLTRVLRLLRGVDLVRPQNVFDPLPWHARWDTARSLLNRALNADYPGTYALRRTTFLRMGGYAGDVLFENLELARTIRAAGGTERVARGLFVPRRPPATRQFWRQRVRQAYDDLAQPGRLMMEASVLPLALILLRCALRPDLMGRRARWALAAAVAATVVVAEIGRRRDGGEGVFPPSAALWAPAWLAERAVCVWIALAYRLTGGVPYAGQRIVLAAHSERTLRTRLSRSPSRRPYCRHAVAAPRAE